MSSNWLVGPVKVFFQNVQNPHGYIDTGNIHTDPIFHPDRSVKPFVVAADRGWKIIVQQWSVPEPKPGEILRYILRREIPGWTRSHVRLWMYKSDWEAAKEELKILKAQRRARENG